MGLGLLFQRSLPVLTLVFLATTMVGCGGPSYELETAPVSGKVTLDGVPLTEGMVQMLPSKGRMAKALIRPDGSFVLSTYGNGDGAQVGKFPVTVSMLLRDGMEGASKQSSVRIPRRYSRPATSGLEIDVRAGETNQVELALTSKPQ